MAPVNSCSNCWFWKKTNEKIGLGMCRRYPPQLVAIGWPIREFSRFPTTQGTQICGEFKGLVVPSAPWMRTEEQIDGDGPVQVSAKRQEPTDEPIYEADRPVADERGAQEDDSAPVASEVPPAEPQEALRPVGLAPVTGSQTVARFEERFEVVQITTCATDIIELVGPAIECFIDKILIADKCPESEIQRIRAASKIIGMRIAPSEENPTSMGREWASE